MWVKIAGYKPHTEDRWINSDLVSEIRWNAREGRFDLTLAADQQGVQVYEAGGIAEIDRLVGSEPHQANPLYG